MPIPAPTKPPKAGTPVPALPVCRFDQIESFRVGTWNGEHFPRAFLDAAVSNFKKYSAGPNAWYRPWVSINHDKTPHLKGLRMGRLLNPTIGADGILRLDAVNVPQEIGTMRNTGMLSEPSIEFVRPKLDPQTGKKTGFVGPDGKIIDGPIIKCLTFLGSDVPAVHGMSELPTAVFHFTGGETLAFSLRTFAMQTRDQMLAALQALNFDVAWITPEVPDEALATILTALQSAAAASSAKPVEPETQPQFADAAANAFAALAGAGAPAGGGAAPMPMPTKIITQFALQNPGLIETVVRAATAQTAAQSKRLDAFEAAQRRAMDQVKGQQVAVFCDQMSTAGQMTPDLAKVLTPMLMGLDNVAVSAFSVGGKAVQTTALEAKFAELRGSLPVLRNMQGRQIVQPVVTHPATGGGDGGGVLDKARMNRILGGTNNAHGQAALKKYNAANAG